ncbi:lysoplasmalogenase [Leifsonia kafniensis]|uniref:Lysoplasmalogenase n=1 Tax=Leifsonia kafniensis TaxID=475957 RepID=A0ABP7K3L8_9MICO
MSRFPLRRLVPFSPYVIFSILHLLGQLAGSETLTQTTKPLLILSLAAALIWSVGARLTAPVIVALIALLLSWVGDVALMISGSLWFVVGLGAFLLAHVAYIVLFLRHLGRGKLPRAALLYLVWLALLVVFLVPYLGPMLVPALLYAVVITTMAIVATRCGPIVTLGALLFLLSDSMLAVNKFVPDVVLPQSGFLVMITYIAAQGLIIVGVVAFVRARAAANATDGVDVSGDLTSR